MLDRCNDGIARVAINRPSKRNAFRPRPWLSCVMPSRASVMTADRGGAVHRGRSCLRWRHAFCAGGDQSVRGDGGYLGEDGLPRLNVLDLQRIIRSLPKVVIALVAGLRHGRWAGAASAL